MKILFLDIDGVLNSSRSCEAYGDYPHSYSKYELFDDVAVNLIRKICTEHNVSVVLSSTWRYDKKWTRLTETLKLPIIDITPRKLSSQRGEEIQMWLNDHQEVSKYAIIDDDGDMLPQQWLNFVQTNRINGMSYQNFQQLNEILKD
jgi:hypothetical protein